MYNHKVTLPPEILKFLPSAWIGCRSSAVASTVAARGAQLFPGLMIPDSSLFSSSFPQTLAGRITCTNPLEGLSPGLVLSFFFLYHVFIVRNGNQLCDRIGCADEMRRPVPAASVRFRLTCFKHRRSRLYS